LTLKVRKLRFDPKGSIALIRQFSKGINPGGKFAFHFTSKKGAMGILKDGSINSTKFGLARSGVYAGQTPTPSLLLKHTSPFGWGLGRTPYRIPINTTGMNTAKAIIPLKTTVIKESKVFLKSIK
jgi:hypothetical protein